MLTEAMSAATLSQGILKYVFLVAMVRALGKDLRIFDGKKVKQKLYPPDLPGLYLEHESHCNYPPPCPSPPSADHV